MAKRKMTETKKTDLKVVAPKIVLLNLDDVNIKAFPNSRSGEWDGPSGDEDAEEDFVSFKANIKAKGQETAVLVRPSNGKGKPYDLIVGFRRYAALSQLAKDGDVRQIKAEVREISNLEARRLNGAENIARENLTPQDQAFAVFELSKEYSAAGQDPRDDQLADDLGMTQAYAGRLLKIMRNVKPQITKAWRNDGVPLTVMDMVELSDVPPAEQITAYEAKLKAATTEAEGKTRGPSAWIDTAKKSAERFGAFLALAEDNGLIALADLTWDASLISFLAENGFVKIGKKGATDAALAKIGKAAHKGYSEAIGLRDEKVKKAEEKAAKAAARESAA